MHVQIPDAPVPGHVFSIMLLLLLSAGIDLTLYDILFVFILVIIISGLYSINDSNNNN